MDDAVVVIISSTSVQLISEFFDGFSFLMVIHSV